MVPGRGLTSRRGYPLTAEGGHMIIQELFEDVLKECDGLRDDLV